MSEVPAIRPYVDLGGVKVAPREGLKLRMEVEEKTKRIVAVTLEYQGSTLQVQAFAAPKSSGLWNDVRHQLTQNLTQQGARVTEQTGTFGPELLVGPAPGQPGQQVRFVGVDGPRWMVRGVILGAGAEGGEAGADIESVFREIVVVRGDSPMPPSELLPLRIPAGMQQQAPEAGAPDTDSV